jgi:DNA-binding NarL/FixJ family response regulator
MYGVAKSSKRGKATGTKAESWSRRIMLFVAPNGSLSESLFYAIEREFFQITVEQVPTLEAACVTFADPVPLILVDTAFFEQIDDYAPELFRHHPNALLALMQDNGLRALSAHEVFASRFVRGVLPMNLKLDVWLSVIRLMLRGGEYFPPNMFKAFVEDVPAANRSRVVWRAEGSAAPVSANGFSELTERETQILEMVARGLQNKTIATALHLSEHTVKIHLHNIITKLGAHNRTEAAAIFHSRQDSPEATNGLPPPPSAPPLL